MTRLCIEQQSTTTIYNYTQPELRETQAPNRLTTPLSLRVAHPSPWRCSHDDLLDPTLRENGVEEGTVDCDVAFADESIRVELEDEAGGIQDRMD